MTGTRIYLSGGTTVWDPRPPQELAELVVGAPVWVSVGEEPVLVRPSAVVALEAQDA
jgi:hypothetical protein